MIRNPSVNPRHELRNYPGRNAAGELVADCSCGQWESWDVSHDQLIEDYQVHRDNIDEAQRLKTQRLEHAAARAMNAGAK